MNNPVAIVDVYDGNTFSTRVDFHGNTGVERAREYAEGQGEVIFSGRTMVLSGVYGGGACVHLSTFVPDDRLDGDSRLKVKNGDHGHQYTLRIFLVRRPRQPERNPLHLEALTLEDIKPGLVMQPYHRRQKDIGHLIVVDHPRHEYRGDRSTWKVKAAGKQSWNDEIVVGDWHLSDLGVVPYEDDHWNSSRYTLAAN